MDSPSPFEVPWVGNFDIILSLWTIQVHLKFHGGGNFDIILSSQTVQVNLKFHGIGIFIYLILVDSLKFHGGGNVDIT